jgi:hypothetical protein
VLATLETSVKRRPRRLRGEKTDCSMKMTATAGRGSAAAAPCEFGGRDAVVLEYGEAAG